MGCKKNPEGDPKSRFPVEFPAAPPYLPVLHSDVGGGLIEDVIPPVEGELLGRVVTHLQGKKGTGRGTPQKGDSHQDPRHTPGVCFGVWPPPVTLLTPALSHFTFTLRAWLMPSSFLPSPLPADRGSGAHGGSTPRIGGCPGGGLKGNDPKGAPGLAAACPQLCHCTKDERHSLCVEGGGVPQHPWGPPGATGTPGTQGDPQDLWGPPETVGTPGTHGDPQKPWGPLAPKGTLETHGDP